MKDAGKYDISCLGEFVDKTLEKEFFAYDIKRYARFVGPIILVFGILFSLFILFDYHSIEYIYSFLIILVIRAVVFIASASIYFFFKNPKNHTHYAYFILGYEIAAITAFLGILSLYKTLSFLSIFSIVAIVVAVYVMPGKLKNASLISVISIPVFFVFSAKKIEGLGSYELIQIIGYIFIIILFCSISAYHTDFYKRKQFADNKELLKVSVTDSLTGIFNRTKFNEELSRAIDFCGRDELPLSLIIFDIDDFKRVNDQHGHLLGDRVIQSVTSAIKQNIRSTDIFARWGGEEFVMLLPNTDLGMAMEMAERMRTCIQENNYHMTENITCSFGLVLLNKDEEAESLIQRADKLLYIAKNKGKNTVVCENLM